MLGMVSVILCVGRLNLVKNGDVKVSGCIVEYMLCKILGNLKLVVLWVLLLKVVWVLMICMFRFVWV